MAKKKSASSNRQHKRAESIADLRIVELHLKTTGGKFLLSEMKTIWDGDAATISKCVSSKSHEIRDAMAVLFVCYLLWGDSRRNQGREFEFKEHPKAWGNAKKNQKPELWYHAVFQRLLSEAFIPYDSRVERKLRKGEHKNVSVSFTGVKLPLGISVEFTLDGVTIPTEPRNQAPQLREILNNLVGPEEAQRLFQKYAQPTHNDFEKLLQAYRSECLNQWQTWFFSDKETTALTPESENKHSPLTHPRPKDRPLFIHDQGLQIFVGDRKNLQFDLHPSRFRGSAEKQVPFDLIGEATDSAIPWMPLMETLPKTNSSSSFKTDGDALLYRLDPSVASAHGVQIPESYCLRRTVIIADSGCGKTVRLRWIRTELTSRKSHLIPFLLNVDELPDTDVKLLQLLNRQLTGTEESADLDDLRHMRDSGKILLLLDAADQIRQEATLNALLTHVLWQSCPIVVSGRPEVIHNLRNTFPHTARFQYVQPMELTDEQVERYIRPTRYSQLENLEDAKDILRNPRVAYYLGYEIPESHLSQLRSASDVFESATRHLLTTGLTSVDAWRLGTASSMKERSTNAGRPIGFRPEASQIERAHGLLSAVAFEQMLLPPEVGPEEGKTPIGGGDIPNFSGVNEDELGAFEERVFRRIQRHDNRYQGRRGWDLFKFDLEQLSAANVAITRGLLDVDWPFREIRWRNKSLQEFYAARWLSNYATDEDIRYLKDRRYHPLIKDTFWFYWVERYLCEMPRRAGKQQRWAYAVEPFLQPGDGTAEGTRRSCEMIYRAWPRLQELAARPARHETKVRSAFLGEFENCIVSGDRDAIADLSRPGALKPSDAAKELKASFVDIPAGRFRMGAPDARQGMGPQLRQEKQAYINKSRNEGSLESFLDEKMQPYKERSRADAQMIRHLRHMFTRVFEEGVPFMEDWLYPHDETPEPDCVVLELAAFQLSRFPVLNRWYRLFDPGHGIDGCYYDDYSQISGSEDRPVIYADWYMSWCFAQFCHWDGQSCELPGEDQWEYAAKAESNAVTWPDSYKDFWWGDVLEHGRHHCTSPEGRTSQPAEFTKAKAGEDHHENPFQLIDILGNVWEWMRDRYRRQYSRTATDGRSNARVLRGGSWYNDEAPNLRCARRYSNLPANTDNDSGCRLMRVVIPPIP